MVKRYQVFVSSTYDDLREQRAEVIQALLELDCIPSGMELFPASDEGQWEVIKRVIDECDYYIVIIAGRYGSVTPTGKSYTQMEYEYAIKENKPVMAFLHQEPGKIAQQNSESDPTKRDALAAFRNLAQSKMCKYWNSTEGLGGVVSRAVAKMKQERPGVGWVRADLVADESAALEIVRLRHVIDDLTHRLEMSKTEQPAGSALFAQGNEAVTLHFQCEVNAASEYVTKEFVTTWSEVLSAVGPLMIDGEMDAKLKDKLVELFKNRQHDKHKIKLYSTYIRDEDFQLIKVQFRALGVIARDARPIRTKDGKTYWILTPYGDTMMTRVSAVHSSVPPGAPRQW